jgi:hypothetical protein
MCKGGVSYVAFSSLLTLSVTSVWLSACLPVCLSCSPIQHAYSVLMVTNIFPPNIMRPGREADHSTHLVPRSRIRGAISPLLQYAFTVWCSVKAQGQLCLYFHRTSCHNHHNYQHIIMMYGHRPRIKNPLSPAFNSSFSRHTNCPHGAESLTTAVLSVSWSRHALLLWNANIRNIIYKNTPLDSIVCQFNTFSTLTLFL